MDAASYLNINEKNRAQTYTVSNIKRTLDNIDSKLFAGFIRTMIFHHSSTPCSLLIKAL